MQVDGTLILLYFKELANHVQYHPPLFEIKTFNFQFAKPRLESLE